MALSKLVLFEASIRRGGDSEADFQGVKKKISMIEDHFGSREVS
jgi:hypothetical protein